MRCFLKSVGRKEGFTLCDPAPTPPPPAGKSRRVQEGCQEGVRREGVEQVKKKPARHEPSGLFSFFNHLSS